MKNIENNKQGQNEAPEKFNLSDVMVMLPTKEEIENHISQMVTPNEDWCGYTYEKGFEAGVMWLIERIKGN